MVAAVELVKSEPLYKLRDEGPSLETSKYTTCIFQAVASLPIRNFLIISTLLLILYLKFKLSNEKTAFVPRDNVIFTVFHSNS
jgi:hypothetical protein